MESLTAVIAVVRALVDAAFGSGGITDAQHTALHGQLDAVDPAHADAEQAAAEAAAAEAADRAAFEAFKASQAAAVPAGDGTEGTGFSG